jgi:integrase
MPLSELFIKSLKVDDKIKKYTDGRGLFLEAHTNGSKYWKLKYRNRLKKSSTTSLGKWPEVSLKDARLAAANFKLHLIEIKNKETKLKDLALDWYNHNKSSYSLKEQEKKQRVLNKYILPILGEYKPCEITTKLILKEVLQPLENRGYFDTVRKAKQILGQIFRYAITIDEAKDNPTSALAGALKPYKVKHRAAITAPEEVGRLLDDIGTYNGSVSVMFALKILPYVFVRPGELRHAEWSEIDFPAKLWRIPAEKMKMSAPHLVPLSEQVVTLMEELKKYTGNGKYLFPGRAAGKPISDAALTAALRYLGYSGERICPHGFRGMASTMLNELGYNSDWIERQLAHAERSGVRAAYNHADYLKERTRMMREWADLLDSLQRDYRESKGL